MTEFARKYAGGTTLLREMTQVHQRSQRVMKRFLDTLEHAREAWFSNSPPTESRKRCVPPQFKPRGKTPRTSPQDPIPADESDGGW